MKEYFEERTLSGPINVACKFENGPTRYWVTDKAYVVKQIIRIVNEYLAEGYVLTLRQLHYQMVSNDPSYINHDTAYKKLGSILDDCRYAGIIDWEAIEDRGRVPYIPYSVRDVEHALQDTVDQYRLDRQEGQENSVELWTEKDALSGILRRSTEKYHIKLVVNKGYTSSSAIYDAYERCLQKILSGKKVKILYFGDHDPSGIDMIRDVYDRLLLFMSKGMRLLKNEQFKKNFFEWWDMWNSKTKIGLAEELANRDFFTPYQIRVINRGKQKQKINELIRHAAIKFYIEDKELFEVIPIGLTKEQIDRYDLPPNPTKMTDSRSEKYVQQHGETCWEVDALKPQILTSIVETNIKKHIDIDQYMAMCDLEDEQIEELKTIIADRKKQ